MSLTKEVEELQIKCASQLELESFILVDITTSMYCIINLENLRKSKFIVKDSLKLKLIIKVVL